MRILLSCLQDLKLHPIPAYRFWADYFRNGLIEAGHEIIEITDVDWAEGCTPLSSKELASWREETWAKTLRSVSEKLRGGCSIDLFLSYLYPNQVEPAAVRQLQRFGIPCVNFFCDNVREFGRLPTEYKSFDLHWVPEFEALQMYRKANLKFVHAPMPVWIRPRDRAGAIGEIPNVVFIGSADPLRRELIAEAIRGGASLYVRGPGWRKDYTAPSAQKPRSLFRLVNNQALFVRQRGALEWLRKTAATFRASSPAEIETKYVLPAVFGDDYVRVTKESQVVLGINRVPSFRRPATNPLKYSRLRDIEAPMMGACYLTEWTEGLEQLYAIGEEVETYRDADEMVAKIEMLQRDRHRRDELRVKGQRRALADHTIANTLNKIITMLGLRLNA